MTIKTATGLAIVGLSIALLMSLFGQFLFSWLYQHSEMPRDSIGTVQSIYFAAHSILDYGSLLIFFSALYSRQKA